MVRGVAMELTQGQLLYYGGVAGVTVSLVLLVVFLIFFEGRKRKMLKRMEEEN